MLLKSWICFVDAVSIFLLKPIRNDVSASYFNLNISDGSGKYTK